MNNATIDAHQVGIEKAIIRVLIRICKFEGGAITALALEQMAEELNRKVETR